MPGTGNRISAPNTLNVSLMPPFYTLIVVVSRVQMTEGSLLKLDEICRQQNVKLIIARSYGLAGLVRISVAVHPHIVCPFSDIWFHCPQHGQRTYDRRGSFRIWKMTNPL